jgi:hypothetical protein
MARAKKSTIAHSAAVRDGALLPVHPG